jgi:hypothetical protein
VIGGLLEVNALFRLRAAQGVLGLAGKHGAARLEKRTSSLSAHLVGLGVLHDRLSPDRT